MRDAYPDAVKDAVDETGLAGRTGFPADCPYAPDDVLDESLSARCELLKSGNRIERRIC